MIELPLEYSDEVARAKAYNLPIVALESTIISHGMPYPDNAKTAYNCEQIIRDNGAVPATIAIINGILKVGLSKEEIDYLARTGEGIQKTSRRDLAYNVANKIDGATTVSATMYIAHLADIKLFATGGIGGVHRNAETTMDISADLEEFAQTPVTVVSAGVKSILDIGLTLEYLETKGVPVLGYQTKTMPAFYSEKSDFEVNFKVDSPDEIARIIETQKLLQLSNGILVANPIPSSDSMDHNIINQAIDQAIIEMEEQHITGKAATPYLLAKIVDLTKGTSLKANIALVYNNCKLAAQIATKLHH